MIRLKGYAIEALEAHSHLGRPYLEIHLASQAEAEKFYEDVKAIGFNVPDDIDLAMNEDESLGLTKVVLDVQALQEIDKSTVA